MACFEWSLWQFSRIAALEEVFLGIIIIFAFAGVEQRRTCGFRFKERCPHAGGKRRSVSRTLKVHPGNTEPGWTWTLVNAPVLLLLVHFRQLSGHPSDHRGAAGFGM